MLYLARNAHAITAKNGGSVTVGLPSEAAVVIAFLAGFLAKRYLSRFMDAVEPPALHWASERLTSLRANFRWSRRLVLDALVVASGLAIVVQILVSENYALFLWGGGGLAAGFALSWVERRLGRYGELARGSALVAAAVALAVYYTINSTNAAVYVMCILIALFGITYVIPGLMRISATSETSPQ